MKVGSPTLRKIQADIENQKDRADKLKKIRVKLTIKPFNLYRICIVLHINACNVFVIVISSKIIKL